jgi:hypothetical protein
MTRFIPDLFLIIPTAGRTRYLGEIFEKCNVLPQNRILVQTRLDYVEFPDCVNLPYFGPINISKWWNHGIQYAENKGAKYVLVLNDDTWIDQDLILDMHQIMEQKDLTLVYSSNRDGSESMGHCWMLNLSHPVRPDNRFSWWYGDFDLIKQAEKFQRSVSSQAKMQGQHFAPEGRFFGGGGLVRVAANPKILKRTI